MSNVLAFPDPQRSRAEASVWLAKLDRGLTADERPEMRHWLKDPSHHKALVEMTRLWHGMDVMSALAELFPLNRGQVTVPRRSFRVVTLAWVAAACMVAIGAMMLFGRAPWALFDPVHWQGVAHNRIYFTQVGETQKVSPGDGSVITLNTSSTIAVLYSPRSRDVYLRRGEANFEVAHDASRPFNVYVNGRTLQAVGTAFNIRVRDAGNIELTVTEGKVRVLPDTWPAAGRLEALGVDTITPPDTLVGAQQAALVKASSEVVRRLEPVELDMRLAWQRGTLIFQHEPLETVLTEVNRYTNTQFVLADPALRNVPVDVYFRADDVKRLLTTLRDNFHINSSRDAHNRIVLTPAPPHAP